MKKIMSLSFTFLVFFSYLHSNNISWSTPPTVISGTGINAADPHLAIDANGNNIALWIENNSVKSSAKTVSGSWTPEVTISGTNASSAKLVSDHNGNATAVWLESGVVKAASKPFGGTWSSPTLLSGTSASSPTLCVDSAGDVVAAWVRGGNIETSTKLFGSSWHTRLVISSTAAASPIIAVGDSGTNTKAVIVWQGTSDGVNAIFSSAKLISGSWAAPVVISNTGQNAGHPFVAVDSNGNALAVWYAYDYDGTNYSDVVVKTAKRSTDSWGDITSLSQSGIRNPATLTARIAFDSIGNAIALWNTSFDDETFSLQSAVKPVYGDWSGPVDVAESNLYGFSADLSATSFGDVVGLYMFYTGASLVIQAIESDVNGFLNNFWSVPVNISLGANNANPKIAASLTGNVIHASAIWVNNDGVHNHIVASTGSKTLVLPPRDLSVSQNVNNFGVFSEYYNTISWNASLDPNAVGYLIFRNGVFIGQVDANVLQFIDNNRTFDGPVTYGVTSINNQQTQSTTVSISFP